MRKAGCLDVIADPARGGRWFLYVLLAFLAVNLVMAAATGVRMGGDSPLYLDGARALLGGEPLAARQPSYLGYISIVAFAQWTGLGLGGLVVLQVVAATFAAAVVCRLGAELGGSQAGLLAAALLTLDVHTNRWHAYVLADSLYASVFTVAVWLVYRAESPEPRAQSLKPYLAAIVVLLAAALIRPEGWFLIPAAAVYWIVRRRTSGIGRWLGVAAVGMGCLVIAAVVAPRLGGNVQAVGPGEMLRQGQTIWDHDGWRLTMPAEPPYAGAGGSAANAVSYAVKHPVSTIALMVARLGVHVAHVRPFYSVAHNLVVVAWLVPVYALGAYAGWRLRRHTLARWSLVAIATQALVVALTHADWDGRYLAHVLPLWYPLAASGLVFGLARWRGAVEVARG